jgi:hypothetical protein
MTSERGKPQALRRKWDPFDFEGLAVALLPEMSIDGSPGEPVKDDPAKELGVRFLDFFSLLRDVARKPDIQLH